MSDNIKTYLKHLLLFVVTFITTTIAGTFWINAKVPFITDYNWTDFLLGLKYSIPFLLILTVHEFGHYFTARFYKIKTSLPYYIPLPPVPPSIGTMGAIIRIKEHINSKRIHFDIGIAGPLAGFVVAVAVLIYGYATLPNLDYLFELHPQYEQFGSDYADHVYSQEFQLRMEREMYDEARIADSISAVSAGKVDEWSFPEFIPSNGGLNISIGKPLLMIFMETFVSEAHLVPNEREIMHYPFLMAGFLALLVTALNLLPIGQLDGGHVLYGMVGYHWHKRIAGWFFIGFILYAGLGYVTPFVSHEELVWQLPLYAGFLYFLLRGLKKSKQDTIMLALVILAVQFSLPLMVPRVEGYSGWLFFALILSRFIGIEHPPAPIEEPLDIKRKILAWLTLIIFVISASPAPIRIG